MVTHSSTSRPVQCLCMAERTGCPVFTDLWSYVFDIIFGCNIKLKLDLRSVLTGVSTGRYNGFMSELCRWCRTFLTTYKALYVYASVFSHSSYS
jgi:hypothetical protein